MILINIFVKVITANNRWCELIRNKNPKKKKNASV